MPKPDSPRPFVWLHACALIPECTCGDREWDVQPPEGYMWAGWLSRHEYPTMQEAMTAAAQARPGRDYVPLPTPRR